MSDRKRPVAAGHVVLLAAAGALLAALVGAGPPPHVRPADTVPVPLSAGPAPLSADAVAVPALTRVSYLQGLFQAQRADGEAPGATREEVPVFGAQPLSVTGVGTVFVPPDGIGMVPDGDSVDIQEGLDGSRASYAPADLPMPPVSGLPRLPHTVYLSYLAAEARERRSRPGCHLDWPMLAGIGEIESSQANAGSVRSDGTTYPPIYGPLLDGRGGYQAVRDTDHGRLDGNRHWDRAVGPMQFMPATWEEWGSDGNGDGRADPQNVYDAALTAARYLCAEGRDLAVPSQYVDAVLNYNDDENYVVAVRAWAAYYRAGALAQARPHPQPAPHPQPTPQPESTPPPTLQPAPPTTPHLSLTPPPTLSPTFSLTPSPTLKPGPPQPTPPRHLSQPTPLPVAAPGRADSPHDTR